MTYLSGEAVEAGDIVRVALRGWVEARVVAVLAPDSPEAGEWDAPLGGAMIDSASTGLVLWSRMDEDIVFVRRGQ